MRFVSYAGLYAREIITDAAALTPALVVNDTFAVIGRVVASALGIPFVNVCAGHDRRPGRVVDGYLRDPRLSVSAVCHGAIESLHALGLDDVTALSWADGVSPYLNVYCEPPAYLPADGRAAFEPIAFYGSLSPCSEPTPGRASLFQSGDRLRVYVSLGSVGWRLFHTETRSALDAIADALGARDDVDAVFSIGHEGATDDELAALGTPQREGAPLARPAGRLGGRRRLRHPSRAELDTRGDLLRAFRWSRIRCSPISLTLRRTASPSLSRFHSSRGFGRRSLRPPSAGRWPRSPTGATRWPRRSTSRVSGSSR